MDYIKRQELSRDTNDILSVWLIGNRGEITPVEDHEDWPESLQEEFYMNV
jgi:hypothetical protein